MGQDAKVQIVDPSSDDRDTGAVHTRAKVIIAHVAWLLQQKGIREIGGIEKDMLAYTQRFGSPSGTPISVTVTGAEPAEVKIEIFTVPRSRFRVDTIDEDQKTMDVALLATRIADGLFHLASALKIDKPKSTMPADADMDPKVVNRSDLNPEAHHGGAPSRSVATRPTSGNVTVHVKEGSKETQVGRVEPKSEEEHETQIVPTQLISRIVTLWVRASKLPETEDISAELRFAVDAAKKSDLKKVRRSLERTSGIVASKKDKAIFGGIARELNQIATYAATLKDVRVQRVRDGEKNDALSRLAAIAKESKSPFMAGGSGKAILSRNRGAIDDMAEAIQGELPSDDRFRKELSPSRLKDFQDLFREVLGSMVPNVSFELRYSAAIKAWSIKGVNWAAGMRCVLSPDGSAVGHIHTAKEQPPTFLRSGKVVYVDKFKARREGYDALAIEMAQRLGTVIRREKLGKD